MAGMLRVPRSRGVLSGFLLLLLGVWGGLIAFVGPYFHYAYTPDHAWAYTTCQWCRMELPASTEPQPATWIDRERGDGRDAAPLG